MFGAVAAAFTFAESLERRSCAAASEAAWASFAGFRSGAWTPGGTDGWACGVVDAHPPSAAHSRPASRTEPRGGVAGGHDYSARSAGENPNRAAVSGVSRSS